jgi:hypothetical protein
MIGTEMAQPFVPLQTKSPSRWTGFFKTLGGLGRNRTTDTRIFNSDNRAKPVVQLAFLFTSVFGV